MNRVAVTERWTVTACDRVIASDHINGKFVRCRCSRDRKPVRTVKPGYGISALNISVIRGLIYCSSLRCMIIINYLSACMRYVVSWSGALVIRSARYKIHFACKLGLMNNDNCITMRSFSYELEGDVIGLPNILSRMLLLGRACHPFSVEIIFDYRWK